MLDGLPYGFLLKRLGERHPRLVVIDAGLGTSMQTADFAAAFPERYINLGIAEANAVSFASGLARRGFRPVVHSFANFLARRAHDQIAVSIALPGLPVILVGGSCGLFDGRNGPSHFGGDDLAAVMALTGFMVFEPADVEDLSTALDWAAAADGPVYLRLRRYGMPAAIADTHGDRRPTRTVIEPKDVPDVTIVAIGAMLDEAVTGARILEDKGLSVELLHVLRLKPLDPLPVLESGRRTQLTVAIENHVGHGGAGSALALMVAAEGIVFHTLSLPDSFLPAGDPRWLLALTGLDATAIAERILQLLPRKLVPCSATSRL